MIDRRTRAGKNTDGCGRPGRLSDAKQRLTGLLEWAPGLQAWFVAIEEDTVDDDRNSEVRCS